MDSLGISVWERRQSIRVAAELVAIKRLNGYASVRAVVGDELWRVFAKVTDPKNWRDFFTDAAEYRYMGDVFPRDDMPPYTEKDLQKASVNIHASDLAAITYLADELLTLDEEERLSEEDLEDIYRTVWRAK